jgi:hypothetical protein
MTEDIERWLGQVAELRHVVVLMQEVRSRNRGRLILPSLEVWNDRVHLHMVQSVSSSTVAVSQEWGAWEVTDDAGTEYARSGGGGGGDGRRWHEAVSFAPSPPAEATRLRIRNPVIGLDVTVDLTGRPA